MPTVITSFGFRHGGRPSLPASALVVDIRPLFRRNPYHNKQLRGLRGDDPAVQAYLWKSPGIQANYARLKVRVSAWPGEVYLGCTGGHHRSVFLADRLGTELQCPVRHLHYHSR